MERCGRRREREEEAKERQQEEGEERAEEEEEGGKEVYLPQTQLPVEVRKMSYTQLSVQDAENTRPYSEGSLANDFIP